MVARATSDDMHAASTIQYVIGSRTKRFVKNAALSDTIFERARNGLALLVNFFLHVVAKTAALGRVRA